MKKPVDFNPTGFVFERVLTLAPVAFDPNVVAVVVVPMTFVEART